MKTCPACGTPPDPGVVTVTTAVPDLPSLVARIVAVPALTAVTSPLEFTVATDAESDDQVIVRPLNVRPAESRRVALRRSLSLTRMPAAPGVTVTDATGATVTVIVAVPLFPSLVARMIAVPALSPVTSPLPLTDATAAE